MNDIQKSKLKKYAEIKKDIKDLELLASELNSEVLDLMVEGDLGEINIEDMGKLSLGSRRTWKYTKETDNIKNHLKEMQKEEEQTGDATYSEKHYVIFKKQKEIEG